MCARCPKHQRGTAARRPFPPPLVVREWWGGSGGYTPRGGAHGRLWRPWAATLGEELALLRRAGDGYRVPGYRALEGGGSSPGTGLLTTATLGGRRSSPGTGCDDGYLARRRKGPLRGP